jgi:hypothetical protein
MPGELSVCSDRMHRLLDNSGKDPEVFKISPYAIVLRVLTESRLDYLVECIEVIKQLERLWKTMLRAFRAEGGILRTLSADPA